MPKINADWMLGELRIGEGVAFGAGELGLDANSSSITPSFAYGAGRSKPYFLVPRFIFPPYVSMLKLFCKSCTRDLHVRNF